MEHAMVLRRVKELFPLLALPLIACSSGDDGDGPRTFSMEFCPGSGPAWVAQQDGSTGAWQRVTPTSADNWEFAFTSDRGGIARVYADGTGSVLEILLASTDELASVAEFRARWSNVCNGNRSDVEVTIAGVPADDIAIVTLGGETHYATEGPLLLTDVLNGTWPLVAVRANPSELDWIAERIILRRGISVPGTGVLSPPIDFDNAESFAAATANLTVTSLEPADGEATVETSFRSSGGTSSTLSVLRMSSASNTRAYGAIPAGDLDTGELQVFRIATNAAGGSQITYAHFGAVADRSVAIGPALATPTVGNAATTPNLRPRVQLPMQAEYDRSVWARFQQSAPHHVSIEATSAYLGNPSSWDITVPDFSEVDGWDANWGLDPAEQYSWSVFGFGGTWDWYDEPAAGTIGRVASIWQPQAVVQDGTAQPFLR
jgi:hypothetical protein